MGEFDGLAYSLFSYRVRPVPRRSGMACLMAKSLSKSDVNHLRRLLAWVRCEIPPSTEEVVKIVHSIAPAIESEASKDKMVEWHREASSVPKYLRAALKALAPLVKEAEGEIVNADAVVDRKLRYSRKQLYNRT